MQRKPSRGRSRKRQHWCKCSFVGTGYKLRIPRMTAIFGSGVSGIAGVILANGSSLADLRRLPVEDACSYRSHESLENLRSLQSETRKALDCLNQYRLVIVESLVGPQREGGFATCHVSPFDIVPAVAQEILGRPISTRSFVESVAERFLRSASERIALLKQRLRLLNWKIRILLRSADTVEFFHTLVLSERPFFELHGLGRPPRWVSGLLRAAL
jgi:hypothetical protein